MNDKQSSSRKKKPYLPPTLQKKQRLAEVLENGVGTVTSGMGQM